MTLKQLLRLLAARRAMVIAVSLSVFAAALGISLVMPKTYLGITSMVVESKDTDPVTGNPAPMQMPATYLSTQVDIITSRAVALKVVDRYRLADDPEMQALFMEHTQGLAPIREWIADRLLRYLEVIPSRNSNVVQISFAAHDPAHAAELANGFADAYLRTSIELKMVPARRQALWFDEQLVGLRKTLEAAQHKLSDFQQSNSLVTTDGRLDIETAKLAGMAAEAVSAQAAMSDAQTRRAQIRTAAASQRSGEVPDIFGNGLLQSMRAELARKEATLAEVGQHYGRNHPRFISASAEVDALRDKLGAEIESARGAVAQVAEIAERRSQEVQRALEDQKARVLELKRANDERDVLSREVESAQRTYDAATLRASTVRMESQLDQGVAAVLTPATPPLLPARPRILLNAVAGLVFGVLLAAGFAVVAELRDRRVRAGADIEEALGLTLLAELPKPLRKKRVRGPPRTGLLIPKLNPG